MTRTSLALVALAPLLVHTFAPQSPLLQGGAGQRFPIPAANDDGGYRTIFDGRTLNGWDGDPRYWRVENGALIDDDPAGRRFDGLIGVQVHVGPPMKIEYRNVRLKML